MLSCDERVKASNGTGPTFYRTTTNEKPLVRLEMSNGKDNNTETVVYFEQGASTEFDSQFDAYDLSSTPTFGDNYTFCSTNKSTKYMINGLPPLKGNTSVQLYLSVPASGTYTISAKDMEFIPQHYCIKLYDKKKDKYTNLRSGTYSFELVENVAEENRFTLYLEESASLSFQTNIKQPVCGNAENKVEIIPNNGEVCSITVFDPSDRVIRQTINSASGITLTNLAPGKYKVTANNSSFCGYAEKYFTIEDVSTNSVNHYAINETCYGSNNAEILVSPAGEGPWYYTWYDSKHRVIKQTQNSNEPSKLTNIGAGSYTVEVAFPKGCAAEIPVFNITSLPQTEALFAVSNETINIDKAQNVEFTNKSKHAAFYEWFVSGDDTQYLCDDLTYTFPAIGTYQVTLNVYDQCGNVNSYSKNIEVAERNTDISAVSSLRLDSDITVQQVDKGAFVKFDYSDNSDAVISICNTLGQELTSPTKVKVQGQNVYLDLKSYGNQVLFITITSSEKRITKKIVNY